MAANPEGIKALVAAIAKLGALCDSSLRGKAAADVRAIWRELFDIQHGLAESLTAVAGDAEVVAWMVEATGESGAVYRSLYTVRPEPEALGRHEVLRPLYATRQAVEGMVPDKAAIEALVAGPFMHHHKMNELQEREAKGFDRCREMTLKNIEIFFATRAAMLAAAAPQAGKGDGND